MLRVRELKVEVGNILTKDVIAAKLKTSKENIISYEIKKESLDARDKNKIYFVYEVNVKVKNKITGIKNVEEIEEKHYEFPKLKVIGKDIIVVGSGPAGLFTAYILCENGYKVTLIERGSTVEDRVKKVEQFWNTGKLDINSNVQFGEGGAGTFSDGKLNTLVKDEFKRGEKVLETFVKFGAPKDIMYSYKPHIGTNILRNVITNMREYMKKKNVKFYFDTCMTDIIIEDNKVTGIQINNSEVLKTDILVLALGHSARDTFKMLYEKHIPMEAKPFSVGLRVEHPQKMIDESQYGLRYQKYLNKASYKLTYKSSNNRGVYSFCMCPGGYVVNASSEENRLAINGMSNHERESKNANSAIIVTVKKEDFNNDIFEAISFQRKIEEKAYNLKHGKIPVQLLKDYMNNIESSKIGNVDVITKGSYELANLNEILPKELNDAIKEAFPYFGKKIKGFDRDDAILLGVESRTSSPIRILRDDNLMSSIRGLYPVGEGAGYAGGITSAAIDGIKCAEEIHKYLNKNS